MNATDPTGMCINDPNCDGSFSEPTQDANPNQGGTGLQDAFNFGDGETYVADPQAFRMDEAIDIGTVIQGAVSREGSVSAQAYASAVENGGSAEFGPVDVGFNGEQFSYLDPGNPSARSIGRFVGTVSGTMSVAEDGSYTVSGSMTFSDNPYSWAADSGPVANLVIGIVGASSRHRPQTGSDVIARNDGTPVPMDFNRTYSFTAWGNN